MWVVFVLSLLLASIGHVELVHAVAYFAEAAGNDADNCTAGNECESFNRLVERSLAAGDTLNLKCGERYRETSQVTAQSSGSSGNPITVQPYGTCFKQTGVHEGSNNAASLVDAGTNFTTVGVTAGMTVLNLTDGSHCNVTSVTTTSTTNDTLVCGMGLAFGLENNWDTNDRYWIANYPIVTHASLFSSGWSEVATNVWSHAVTMHPARHVWINGWSPNSSHHDGTCSGAGMSSATDTQWCTTASVVLIKSTSNPATRWTAPGVEVTHLFNNQSVVFSLNTRDWWTVTNIVMEKVYGTFITGSTAENITVTGGRYGWSQRSNCVSSCWNGNSYSWLSGEDDRGGQLMTFTGTAPYSNITLQDFVGHDCDNNCITFAGAVAATGLSLTNVEIFNNFHSIINSGLSSSSAGSRALTMTRLSLHGGCTMWHTGNTGASHTATLQDSIIYDATLPGDTRIFSPAGGCVSNSFGVYVQDNGTYTIRRNIIRDTHSGYRATKGTHHLTQNIITANTIAGVNANSVASIQLDDNIIAGNGAGTVSSNDFQVGCQFAPCTATSLYTSTSNNNKFDQPSGTSFAYLNGVDTSMTLAEWQSRFGGDGSSTTGDSCFVSASTFDYNLADGCSDIAAGRGPFREITVASGTITGTSLAATFTVSGTSPLSRCTAASGTVEYNNVGQTISSCTAASPSSAAITLVIAAAPGAGQTVELRAVYGFVEDSQKVGGFLNARSRAFTDTAVTNAGGTTTTGWVVGTNRTIPSGTDRILLVGVCWEKNTPAGSPTDITSITYGGQSLTKITDVNITNGAEPEVLATLWRLNEAGIVAASSTLLVVTPDESADVSRPLIVFSGVYEGIDQTTPVLDTETASHATASSVTTAALSPTSNPGVAVAIACAGNHGAWTAGSGWTEQADAGEDASPGTRAYAADRDTTGDTPAGSATFTPDDAFGNRLAMIAVSLDGGEDLPTGSVTRTQTASVCFMHNEGTAAALVLTKAQGEICSVMSGFSVGILSEWHVSDANEPSAVGKRLQCCTDGVCNEPGDYTAVDDVGANGVRYTGTLHPAIMTHAAAVPSRVLTGAACTYVPGSVQTQNTTVPTQLDAGECSNAGHTIQITLAAPATVKCRLALEDNSPLVYAAGADTTITVKAGEAWGP